MSWTILDMSTGKELHAVDDNWGSRGTPLVVVLAGVNSYSCTGKALRGPGPGSFHLYHARLQEHVLVRSSEEEDGGAAVPVPLELIKAIARRFWPRKLDPKDHDEYIDMPRSLHVCYDITSCDWAGMAWDAGARFWTQSGSQREDDEDADDGRRLSTVAALGCMRRAVRAWLSVRAAYLRPRSGVGPSDHVDLDIGSVPKHDVAFARALARLMFAKW